jgi:ribosomal protein S18 acetylase RimI-like enzyme
MNEQAAPLAAGRMTIRPARLDEIDVVSDIVNDPPNAGAIRIAGNAEKAVRGGRVLSRAGLSLHLPSTVVAEIDGEVAGIMDAGIDHPEPRITPGVVLRLLPTVLRTVGPGGFSRLLRSRPAYDAVAFPTDRASYYIAELDVQPAWRNRGIGGRLLDYGERQARASGAPRMTLVTDITNPARHLYDRHGFVVRETKMNAAYERWSAVPGRVFMVKELG